MGLNTRELFLVLRARDEASRVLRGMSGTLRELDKQSAEHAQKSLARGGALATVGVGIAAAGIVGIAALNNMTDAAIKYNQSVAYTQTQVDKGNASFQNLWDIGMRIGKDIPVAFDQIQPTLYDIFSSIDVTAAQSEILLKNIAMAAVGGQVDMQTAGKATIGILNAYKLNVKDTVRVNDIMFQMVRKGVGTYENFSSAIGRAIPSSIKAGQSVESLAGMMAFMTRNGLTAAMSAASVGRALDAISNPGTIISFRHFGSIAADAINGISGPKALAAFEAAHKGFNKINVSVLDGQGKIRPMIDIIHDLRKATEGMTKAQISATTHELFKGSGGTIQAMRFYNHALADSHNLLGEMTNDMKHAGGAAKSAYNIMQQTPAAKLQLLKNRYQEMTITVGNQLIPVKMKLVEVLGKILGLWTNLNPHVQKIITYFVLFASVGAVVLGVVVAVAGIMLMLSGALELLGVGLGVASLAFVGIIAVIALLALAGYEIYKHWDIIKVKLIAIWDKFYERIHVSVEKIVSAFQGMVAHLMPHIMKFISSFKGGGEAVIHIANAIMYVLAFAFNFLKPQIIAVGKVIFDIFGRILDVVGSVIKFVIDLINGDWNKAWHDALNIVKSMFNLIWASMKGFVVLIVVTIKDFAMLIIGWFKHLWDVLVGHSIVPDMINSIIKWFLSLPLKIMNTIAKFVLDILMFFGNLELKGIQAIGRLIGSIVSWFAGLPGKILSAVGNFALSLLNTIGNWEISAIKAVSHLVSNVVSWFAGLPGKILDAISGLGQQIFNAGANLMTMLMNGIGSMASSIAGKVKGVLGPLAKFLPGSPVREGPLMVLNNGNAGKKIISMIADGMTSNKHLITNAFSSSIPNLNGGSYTPSNNNGPTNPAAFGGGSSNGVTQIFNIYTQEIDPRKHAADLGWELANR